MSLVVAEDGVEVAQGVVVDVFGDPVAHGAVKRGELPIVLFTPAAVGGGAIGGDITVCGFGRGGAVER